MLAFNVLNNMKKEKQMKINIIFRKTGNFKPMFETLGLTLKEASPKKIVDFNYFIELRKYVIKNKINIIHAHQPIDLLYFYIATIGLKTKLLITHHGFSYKENQKYFILFATVLANKNIFVSNSSLIMYEKLLNKKINEGFEILHNGIDINKLKPQNINDIKSELKIPSDAILFAMTANFYIDARDQFTVCKALNNSVKKNRKIHFLFIGGKSKQYSEYFDNCFNYCVANAIDNNVHFLGLRHDVPNILNQINYYVYSTKYETFGISVLEAMANGIECVVNDIPPMMEITENGKYGIIYKTGDYDKLSEIISELANKKSGTEVKENLKKYVKENFSIEKHIRSLIGIYRQTLAN
jgi:glycosyltransferase involved in cell wall biosynthesis